MAVRAGIVVTGTEVLTGRVTDRNGPWVATQLLDLGVDVAHITICGDRPDDLMAQLRFLADEKVDLIVTTGGLGPTADDLTVEVVARFCGRELRLDTDLSATITDIVRRWSVARGADPDVESVRVATEKQAMVPVGAQAIPPSGTAPGVAVPAESATPAVLVLPGPPRELQHMWPIAVAAPPIADAIAARTPHRQETVRMMGLPESELAESLRIAEPEVPGFSSLEITTCLRRGEVEMVTRFAETDAEAYDTLLTVITERHERQIFSADGSTIDDQIAALLAGRRIATAESCTAGMIAARLTDRAGSSAYVMGGVASYSNEAKTELLGVPADLIAAHGAVSEQVAAAMARGALTRFGANTALSTTGIAGPGGGTEEKPVGTVCFGVAVDGEITTRRLVLPGDRTEVRERSVTIALHLLRQRLTGP